MSLSVSASSISETSFICKVQTSGSVFMQHNWYLDDELYKTVQTVKGETSSSCLFSGLSSGTNYSIRVVVYTVNPWQELDRGNASVTTKGSTRPSRPSDWYWNNLGSTGSVFNMTASEWNDFILKIQEFAKYKGVSLSSSTLSKASASKGYAPLASQANAVRALIDQLDPRISVPNEVFSGAPITIAFFIALKNSLNSVS